jgi:hypothetical protein
MPLNPSFRICLELHVQNLLDLAQLWKREDYVKPLRAAYNNTCVSGLTDCALFFVAFDERDEGQG